MEVYKLISLIIVLTAAFGYLNHRFIKLPGTIGIMIISLAASLGIIIIGFFNPDLFNTAIAVIRTVDFHTALMKIMLSFLLFAGAMHIDVNKLKKELPAVIVFSTAGVIMSTFIVGALLFYVARLFGLQIDFIYCLLFGSLISPTDPIAVLGILRKAKIPATLELKISGESLFNDGIGVVVFITISEIISTGIDNITIPQIGWLFLKEAGGGILVRHYTGLLRFLVIEINR